mmetsp:Transcript_11588/g.41331  ORF Transcript_11588/g.41331 Transcript_11588/m.41331 type:complete len:213 (-) Transcript_11588:2027-2665(-)
MAGHGRAQAAVLADHIKVQVPGVGHTICRHGARPDLHLETGFAAALAFALLVLEEAGRVPLLPDDDDELGAVVLTTHLIEGLDQTAVLVGEHWLELAIGNAIPVIENDIRQPVRIHRPPPPDQRCDHAGEVEDAFLALSAPLLELAEVEAGLSPEFGEVVDEGSVAGRDHAGDTHVVHMVCNVGAEDHGRAGQELVGLHKLDVVTGSRAITL